MDIASLRATITATEHWRKVDLLDRSTYPMALAATGGIIEADEDLTTVSLDSHDYLAVFDPNVSISLVWGLQRQAPRARGVAGRSTEPWSTTGGFPDPTVSYTYAELRWNGQPIDQVGLVIVDGGRGYLPAPTPHNPTAIVGPYDAARTTYSITVWQCDVASLVSELTGLDDFESYLQRSQFTVTDLVTDVPGSDAPGEHPRHW